METNEKYRNEKGLKGFYKRHIVLSNVVFIIITIPVLLWLGLLFIDLWTHHGATTVVPNVRDLSYDKACTVLDEADLTVVISDSIYDLKRAPGEVVDIFPKPGAIVKPGREVYLTIVSFSPQQVVFDVPVVDQSVKSAIAYLKNKGIKTVKIVRVPSQYPDLVLSMKWNGKALSIGSKVPVTATITLEVGELEVPVYESGDSLDGAINNALDRESAEASTELPDIQTLNLTETPDPEEEPQEE